MKNKYYIGLDVHKRQTTYSVKDWDGKTVQQGRSATQYSDLQKSLVAYLKKGVVAMEASTSYYSLYKEMKANKVDVHVANVIQLRKVIGKNDRLDSERLADMLRLNAMPESYIPDEKIQSLRVLMNLYHGVVEERVRYKNQIHAILDRNGTKTLFKDIFTNQGLLFLNEYLKANNNFALRNIFEAYINSSQRIDKMKCEISSYLKINFTEEYNLLMTIPGVGEIISGYLVAEICPIDRFINKKKLRRYAGVVPIKEQSDKKIYATYLPKHASRKLLRYALVLAANCAVKKKCRLKEYYQKKKKGSCHAHAVMCVASSLSDIVYNVLKYKQIYRL